MISELFRIICVNKAAIASAQAVSDYGWGDADYDRKWRWIVTDPNDNKVYIPDKNGKASSTVEPIKISGETFGAGELTPGEYTVRLELSGRNEESGREYDWGYAYHEEKFVAVKAEFVDPTPDDDDVFLHGDKVTFKIKIIPESTKVDKWRWKIVQGKGKPSSGKKDTFEPIVFNKANNWKVIDTLKN